MHYHFEFMISKCLLETIVTVLYTMKLLYYQYTEKCLPSTKQTMAYIM